MSEAADDIAFSEIARRVATEMNAGWTTALGNQPHPPGRLRWAAVAGRCRAPRLQSTVV